MAILRSLYGTSGRACPEQLNMAKKKKPSSKYQSWIDAQRRFSLSDEQILMARELGMNPKKFGSLANYKQEPWKSPLPDFIEELYFKHFGKTKTDNIRSFLQMVKNEKQKTDVKLKD
jgi:hypothetical protein